MNMLQCQLWLYDLCVVRHVCFGSRCAVCGAAAWVFAARFVFWTFFSNAPVSIWQLAVKPQTAPLLWGASAPDVNEEQARACAHAVFT